MFLNNPKLHLQNS